MTFWQALGCVAIAIFAGLITYGVYLALKGVKR